MSASFATRLQRRFTEWQTNLNPRRFDLTVLAEAPERAPSPGGQAAIFSHFDAGGEVAGYVERHLEALSCLGLALVFVTTSERLSPDGLARIAPHCWLVAQRQNQGLDIGGWPCAVRKIEAVTGHALPALSRLVLVNDSVYGPLRSLQGVFDAMAARRLDLWGITDSIERQPHLQSYFLVFEGAGLAFFSRWLARFRFITDREELIGRYEVGLSVAARNAGLRIGALVSIDEICRRIDRNPASVAPGVHERYMARHGALNPTHAFWRETLEMGSPFVKRDLLRDYTRFDDGRPGWQAVLQDQAPDYPQALIAQPQQAPRA